MKIHLLPTVFAAPGRPVVLLSAVGRPETPAGREVRTALIEGFRFSYCLPDSPPGERRLLLRLTTPGGEPVSTAVVVYTVIRPGTGSRPAPGVPLAGGFLLDLGRADACQVETEVITGGFLLTDEFSLEPPATEPHPNFERP